MTFIFRFLSILSMIVALGCNRQGGRLPYREYYIGELIFLNGWFHELGLCSYQENKASEFLFYLFLLDVENYSFHAGHFAEMAASLYSNSDPLRLAVLYENGVEVSEIQGYIFFKPIGGARSVLAFQSPHFTASNFLTLESYQEIVKMYREITNEAIDEKMKLGIFEEANP